MPRPYEMTMAPSIAGTQRAQSQALAQRQQVSLPTELRDGGDPHRQGRLANICDGLMSDYATEAAFAHQIGDLRLASGNAMQFRQALIMLMHMHNISGEQRNVMTDRAMQWYRARDKIERGNAPVWAKSFVQVAQNYAGRWL